MARTTKSTPAPGTDGKPSGGEPKPAPPRPTLASIGRQGTFTIDREPQAGERREDVAATPAPAPAAAAPTPAPRGRVIQVASVVAESDPQGPPAEREGRAEATLDVAEVGQALATVPVPAPRRSRASPASPAADSPVASAPVASTPAASAPVASAPVASTPAASAPVASAPVASTPAASAPGASAPVASASAASAPAASAPVSSAPVSSTKAVSDAVAGGRGRSRRRLLRRQVADDSSSSESGRGRGGVRIVTEAEIHEPPSEARAPAVAEDPEAGPGQTAGSEGLEGVHEEQPEAAEGIGTLESPPEAPRGGEELQAQSGPGKDGPAPQPESPTSIPQEDVPVQDTATVVARAEDTAGVAEGASVTTTATETLVEDGDSKGDATLVGVAGDAEGPTLQPYSEPTAPDGHDGRATSEAMPGVASPSAPSSCAAPTTPRQPSPVTVLEEASPSTPAPTEDPGPTQALDATLGGPPVLAPYCPPSRTDSAPDPVPDPTHAPPVHDPAPDPTPTPVHDPAPDSTLTPVHDPVPDSTLTPVQDPVPDSTLTPAQDPVPDSTLTPVHDPVPDSTPTCAQDPAPAVTPASTPSQQQQQQDSEAPAQPVGETVATITIMSPSPSAPEESSVAAAACGGGVGDAGRAASPPAGPPLEVEVKSSRTRQAREMDEATRDRLQLRITRALGESPHRFTSREELQLDLDASSAALETFYATPASDAARLRGRGELLLQRLCHLREAVSATYPPGGDAGFRGRQLGQDGLGPGGAATAFGACLARVLVPASFHRALQGLP